MKNDSVASSAVTFFAWVVAIFSFGLWFHYIALGRPPVHCQYVVSVQSTPGVYACSEYPRIKIKP